MTSSLTQRKVVSHTSSPSPSPSPSFSSPPLHPLPLWQCSNVNKSRGEIFFLKWGVAWVTLMALIVATRAFESFDANAYMIVGLIIGLPPIFLPLIFNIDTPGTPFWQRYTTKANIWVFVLSWVGNYFWTHYFYTVLGCGYTFPAHRLNNVPFCLFLITHSYFLLYHSLSNMLIRSCWRLSKRIFSSFYTGRVFVVSIVIVLEAVAIAFMETFSIQNFQYYTIPDRAAMYTYGSMFYAIYFIVSFPRFYLMDESSSSSSSSSFALWDSMASCMVVTILLDAWRITIGSINTINIATVSVNENALLTSSGEPTLPFFG